MSKIFISHSSQDNAKALAVGEWLKGNGWNEYFLDITPSQGISPGERWQEALKKAADRCEVVLFLISPRWRDSKWCLAEFLLAKQLGKRIFGVLIEPTAIDSLPKEMTTEWQLANLVDGNRQTTIAVQHEPLVSATTIAFAEAGLALLKQGLQKAGLDPTHFDWPPKHDPNRVPYRGLKALEADDAAIFFGRDAAIVRGLDKLRLMRDEGVERLFVILGASGAGKSSYMRAGLWPRLARDDRHFLPLPVIRPETHVITGPTGLIAAVETTFKKLGAKRNRGDLRQALESPGGFDQLLIELQALAQKKLIADTEPPTIILPIDQGEELFGADGRDEAEHFLSLLGFTLSPPTGDLKSAQATRRRVIGIIAIRSDSYDRLQTSPSLAAAKHNPFNLKPIAREDFRTIIEGPAKVITDRGQKLAIDPKLKEQLLVDTTGADALPLLAFTLERLYLDYGKDGDLLLDEYEKLGGVRGSIEAAVTTALANPDQPPAIPRDLVVRDERLRQTFIPWLAGIDPETGLSKRRVACQEELPEEAQPLIKRLIQARLLTQDQRTIDTRQGVTTIIEVAHEALLRQWPTLTKWLDQDAEQLKTTEMVRRSAAEWEKNGRGDEWLDLRGDRLKAAETLRQRPDLWNLLSQQGQDYITKCREKEDRERTERKAQLRRTAHMQSRIGKLLVIVAVVVIAGALGVLMQTREVGRKTSLVLATQSKIAGDEGHYGRAIRFAVLAARETWWSPSSNEANPQLLTVGHKSTMLAQLTHEAPVRSAAFTPDGSKVLTTSGRTARVWDVITGKELARFSHEASVQSSTFSLDGTKVLTTSVEDRTSRAWNMAIGQEMSRFSHSGDYYSHIASPDGSRILTIAEILSASKDTTAHLWDRATGKELAQLPHEDQVGSATFSLDGSKIVTTSGRTTRVWDVTTGKELARLSHETTVESSIFSPDGTKVLTVSYPKTARVWTAHVWAVATGKELTRFSHEGLNKFATFSRDGSKVVTASSEISQVWDAITGKLLARFSHENGHITAIALSPNGTEVLTASDDRTARIWSVATGKELARCSHEASVQSATFSPDGTKILTASNDKTARIWAVATSREIGTFSHDNRLIESFDLSHDGTKMLTTSRDKTARIWNVITTKELARFSHHLGSTALALSPDGTKALTAADDKTARVWNVATGIELAQFSHRDKIRFATFSHDGTKVVIAADDKTARVWNVATGNELAQFSHLNESLAIAFSPDSSKLLTGSDDRTTRIWDIATGNELARFSRPTSFATFSPDGSKVVTNSVETTHVWDATTGKELSQFPHKNDISFATFSPDGTKVLTASRDKTARIWDLVTSQELAQFSHKIPVWSATFSAGGTKILTFSSAEFDLYGWYIAVKEWDVAWLTQHPGQDLIEQTCQEKLIGAHPITKQDIEISPILSGREGEDVCDPPSWFSRLTKKLGL